MVGVMLARWVSTTRLNGKEMSEGVVWRVARGGFRTIANLSGCGVDWRVLYLLTQDCPAIASSKTTFFGYGTSQRFVLHDFLRKELV